jgi:gp16 family phage-associated protein
MMIMSTLDPSHLDAVRKRFYLRGESVAEWARLKGFDERNVYSVLSGRSRASRGKCHLIAIELGLKPRWSDEAREVFVSEGVQP